MHNCPECKKVLTRSSRKYCSNQCQALAQYNLYIAKWKNHEVDGNRGIYAKNISRHVKRYLTIKYFESCCKCGWNLKHPTSGISPLEIDHIDGDADNNREENLQLLCPNCHSLTENFKNFNKGYGRSWRRVKYLKSL
jgi:HNH endonuclease